MFDGSNAHVLFPKSSSRFEFITADIHTDATTFIDFIISHLRIIVGGLLLEGQFKLSLTTTHHLVKKLPKCSVMLTLVILTEMK